MMERTWTTVGEDCGVYRADLEAAIDAVEWRDVNGTWPASPGLAIKVCIRELRIPKVRRAGISTVTLTSTAEVGAAYALYAIEGHYSNGRVNVYVLDRGSVLTPVASEIEEQSEVLSR